MKADKMCSYMVMMRNYKPRLHFCSPTSVTTPPEMLKGSCIRLVLLQASRRAASYLLPAF